MNNKRLECFSDTPDSVTRLRAIFDDKMPTDPKWRLMWECGFDTAVLDMRRRLERAESLLNEVRGWCPQGESHGGIGYGVKPPNGVRERIDAFLSGVSDD